MVTLGFIFLGCCALLYFVPTILANQRGTRGTFLIFVCNLLLGWTVFGWIACLLWAVLGERHAAR